MLKTAPELIIISLEYIEVISKGFTEAGQIINSRNDDEDFCPAGHGLSVQHLLSVPYTHSQDTDNRKYILHWKYAYEQPLTLHLVWFHLERDGGRFL